MKDQWLKKFKNDFYPKLDINDYPRSNGFNLIFETLLEKKESNFLIIETGVSRGLSLDVWSDGMSTYLFLDFINYFSGSLFSIDISRKSINRARTMFKNYNSFHPVRSDSLIWLKENNLENIDLFYLDSYDVNWNDDTLSAEHHFQEFKIIEPFLKKNSIVAIDDNIRKGETHIGKGSKIYEYLANRKIYPVYDGYHIIYVWG